MKHISFFFISFVIVILFLSCDNSTRVNKQMEIIKAIGDKNPALAQKMLDSLKLDVRNADEYTMMKYDLLTLRINDKSYIVPTSDYMSKQVVNYFSKHGDNLEKQEAYYYNGSVYRDLQDAPRAIDNFLKSVDFATKDYCDSIMLKNSYSNLVYLFFNVQDYRNSLVYAKKEYIISGL